MSSDENANHVGSNGDFVEPGSQQLPSDYEEGDEGYVWWPARRNDYLLQFVTAGLPLNGRNYRTINEGDCVRAVYRLPRARKHNPFTGDCIIQFFPTRVTMKNADTTRQLHVGAARDFSVIPFFNHEVVRFGEFEIQYNPE